MQEMTIKEDVLRVLREAERPIGKREIRARMVRDVKKSTLSAMLSTMAYDGLVESAKTVGAESLFRYIGNDGGAAHRLARAMDGWIGSVAR